MSQRLSLLVISHTKVELEVALVVRGHLDDRLQDSTSLINDVWTEDAKIVPASANAHVRLITQYQIVNVALFVGRYDGKQGTTWSAHVKQNLLSAIIQASSESFALIVPGSRVRVSTDAMLAI